MIGTILHHTTHKDFILLYSAGLGGEYITSLISECTNTLNTLERVKNKDNRWNTVCKIGYADIIHKDKELQWRYAYTSENDKNKNDLYKDHPGKLITHTWPSYMTCLFLTVNNDYTKWANVTWNKLHEVNITTTKKEFVKQHANTIKEQYNQRHEWKNYFKKYYEIDVNDPAKQLSNVFKDFDVDRFNKKFNEWKMKNDKR